MELTLSHLADSRVTVVCDTQPSHTFDITPLMLDAPINGQLPPQLHDPVAYGRMLYDALFPQNTSARQALDALPERILLVTTDHMVQAVPWEYLYGPDGFLVADHHLVRGLPAEQRIAVPPLDGGLHIVAVPSNPLDDSLPALNIEGEWERLTRVIGSVEHAVMLERTRPPTMAQLRELVAGRQHRIVHFMGHGGQGQDGAALCFEDTSGGLDMLDAQQLVRYLRGTVFLVTLNACVSATPGPTPFSDLAAALVQRRTPYVLGMRFGVLDDDALTISRTFYSELARGTSVEEAVRIVRLRLVYGPRPWTVGVPVLYTALSAPAPSFALVAGQPKIIDRQPPIEAFARSATLLR